MTDHLADILKKAGGARPDVPPAPPVTAQAVLRKASGLPPEPAARKRPKRRRGTVTAAPRPKVTASQQPYETATRPEQRRELLPGEALYHALMTELSRPIIVNINETLPDGTVTREQLSPDEENLFN